MPHGRCPPVRSVETIVNLHGFLQELPRSCLVAGGLQAEARSPPAQGGSLVRGWCGGGQEDLSRVA